VGGVNDWLAGIVAAGQNVEVSSIIPGPPVEGFLADRQANEGHEGGGYGRIVTLSKDITNIDDLIANIKRGLGVQHGILASTK